MEYIILKISAQTLNTIGAALQELPYKVSAPAIKEIDEQVKDFLSKKEQENDNPSANT